MEPALATLLTPPWDLALRPFVGYTTLAMGDLNRDFQKSGYSVVNRGVECGVEAPLSYKGFTFGPRLYAISSNEAESVGGTTTAYLFAFPIEMGLGYAWSFGPLSLDAEVYAGAL